MVVRILGVLMIVCGSINLQAQIVKPDSVSRHLAGINMGYDFTLISVSLNYGYYIPKFHTAPFIDFTQGTSLLATGNWRAQTGIQTWLGSRGKFNLKTTLAFTYAASENNAGRYDALGLNIQLNPGWKGKKIAVGPEFQYMPFFFTRIHHSAYWRQYSYSNAVDGWYSLTGANVRLGGHLAFLFGTRKQYEINLRAGYQTSGQYDKLIPGIYSIIGANYKL